jgi:hypothetical protein
MKSSACVSERKLNVLLRIVLSIVTIAPLWLMLGATNTSAFAQTSDDVFNSNAATSSPGETSGLPTIRQQFA